MTTSSPLPEAIDGKKWVVGEGTGMCNTVDREMLVPLGGSSADRFVRNHEMGHARITPRANPGIQCRKFGISIEALQVCEDLRVHHYLGHVGVDRCGGLTNQEMELVLSKRLHDDRKIAAALVASLHTGDWDRACSVLVEKIGAPRLNTFLENVRLIDRRLRGGRGIFRPIGMRNCTVPAARLFDALYPEKTGDDPSTTHQIPLKDFRMRDKPRQVKWGTMTVRELALEHTRRSPAVMKSRSYRDEGAILGAVHRLPVDGRIFTKTRLHRGGTVLIDGSGSMSLSLQDLDRIIATAPAATIALYCGIGKRGGLTVIARKGRVVNPEGLSLARSPGFGNVVDGPALQWLSQQPAPRLWVSDGHVTGAGDRSSIDLAVEAQLICRKAGIRRIEKTANACDMLRAAKGR
jgi:hypothetical protein